MKGEDENHSDAGAACCNVIVYFIPYFVSIYLQVNVQRDDSALDLFIAAQVFMDAIVASRAEVRKFPPPVAVGREKRESEMCVIEAHSRNSWNTH